MEVTLAPTLTALQKSLLRDWLIVTLNDAELSNTRPYPLASAVSLYIDGVPRKVQSGAWVMSMDYIYLAKSEMGMPVSERLPILLTLSQLCEQSEALTKACSKAITNYLLGEHRALSSHLIASSMPVSGIAFSCDNRVASLLGAEWMLPSGEVVDVSGPDWVVCASEVPPTQVQEVAVDDQLGVGTGGETIDDPPIDAEYQFSVGQRVHWTPLDPDTQGGEGEILQVPNESLMYYRVLLNDVTYLATLEELRAIDTPTTFVVGQRVHWSSEGFGEHDGVLTALPTEEQAAYIVQDDEGLTWHCAAHELRAI